MKKVLSFMIILAVVCTTVAATVNLSFGGFGGTGEVNKGAYLSAAYQPWTVGKTSFGFKADCLIGVTDAVDKLHSVGSIKAIVTADYDEFILLAGIGTTFDGYKAGVIAMDSEVAAKKYFNGNWAFGASFDMAFAAKQFSWKQHIFEKATYVPSVISAVRVFFDYQFNF